MVEREHDRTTVRDETDRRDWRRAAACRDIGDPELFFPVADGGPARREQEARAKAVCAGCPVIEACRAWALDTLPVGVAGGLSETERHAQRRRSRSTRAGSATLSGVDGVRRVLVPANPTRSERAAAGRAALASGEPDASVAARFGVSRDVVYQWRHRAADHAPLAQPGRVGAVGGGA